MHALAADGATVVVSDISDPDTTVREVQGIGGAALGVRCDVSDYADAGNMIRIAIDSFGKLDIVVANAGILRASKIHEQAHEDWASIMAVHLGGTFNDYRHAIPHMIERRSGTFLTTGAAPLEGYFPGLAAYRAAKAAILVLTLSAANELLEYGINVNSIMPGSTITPMQQSFMASVGKAAKHWPKGSPPETIPPLGVFLCTDEGRSITGYSFHILGDAGIKVVKTFGSRTMINADGERWEKGEIAARLPALL